MIAIIKLQQSPIETLLKHRIIHNNNNNCSCTKCQPINEKMIFHAQYGVFDEWNPKPLLPQEIILAEYITNSGKNRYFFCEKNIEFVGQYESFGKTNTLIINQHNKQITIQIHNTTFQVEKITFL